MHKRFDDDDDDDVPSFSRSRLSRELPKPGLFCAHLQLFFFSFFGKSHNFGKCRCGKRHRTNKRCPESRVPPDPVVLGPWSLVPGPRRPWTVQSRRRCRASPPPRLGLNRVDAVIPSGLGSPAPPRARQWHHRGWTERTAASGTGRESDECQIVFVV